MVLGLGGSTRSLLFRAFARFDDEGGRGFSAVADSTMNRRSTPRRRHDRLADLDELAAREVGAVVEAAHTATRFAGENRADLDLLDTRFLNRVRQLFGSALRSDDGHFSPTATRTRGRTSFLPASGLGWPRSHPFKTREAQMTGHHVTGFLSLRRVRERYRTTAETLRQLRQRYNRPRVMYGIAPVLFLVMCIASLGTHTEGSPTEAIQDVIGQVVKHGVPLALLALGASLVLACGGVDISTASVAALSGVLFAAVANRTPSNAGSVVAGVVAALSFGCISGVLLGAGVTRRRSPLILSWALGVIWTIGALIIATLLGKPSAVALPAHLIVGYDFWLWGRAGFFVLLLALLIILSVLHMSNLARQACAVGANRRSAEYAGVPTDAVELAVYITSGLTAAVAGVLWALISRAGTPTDFVGRELVAVSVAVLGGTVMSGGYLFLPSVAAAALFWAVTKTFVDGLELPMLGEFQQHVANGVFAGIFILVMVVFGSRLAGRTFIVHIDQGTGGRRR